ncbi:unnamed protein product [Callosobruchus maculatus]|nr:unnamed protein product [Callosobruchus maculatus]
MAHVGEANGCDVSGPLRWALRKVVTRSIVESSLVDLPVRRWWEYRYRSTTFAQAPEKRRHLSLLLLWVLGADVSSDISDHQMENGEDFSKDVSAEGHQNGSGDAPMADSGSADTPGRDDDR